MLDRRELDRIAKAARLRTAKRPEIASAPLRVSRDCGCVGCGYNLKTLPFTGVCPECATPVSRSINPEEPDAKPWIDASRWRPAWWISYFGPPAPPAAPPPVGVEAEVVKPKPKPAQCAVCGYDCTGLPRGRPCPECGTPRTLSTLAGAAAGQEAVQGLSGHGWSGALLALGWGAAGVGAILVWVAHLAGGALSERVSQVSALLGYGLGALGGCAAALACVKLLITHPPAAVKDDLHVVTRFMSVCACAAWGAANVPGLLDAHRALMTPIVPFVWNRLEPGPLVLLGLAWFPLAFYCRGMAVLASMVDRGERTFRSGVIGFPMCAVFLLGVASWCEQVSGRSEGTFVVLIGASMVVGLFPVTFVTANIRVGMAIWWAPQNLKQSLTRDERRREKWEARARADREKERRFGNSSRH